MKLTQAVSVIITAFLLLPFTSCTSIHCESCELTGNNNDESPDFNALLVRKYVSILSEPAGKAAMGSLTPLGNMLGLTAKHVITDNPVAWLDGQLTGVDIISEGADYEGPATPNDWIQVRINNIDISQHNYLEFGHTFHEGDVLYFAGFPGRGRNSLDAVKKCIIRGVVKSKSLPFWIHKDTVISNENIILLSVNGNPDLSGMSGGPVAYRDPEHGWVVVGIFIGQYYTAFWHGYGVLALPEQVRPYLN